MADIDVERTGEREGYTVGELIFWILGILAIPLVPILMVTFLTPHSGM
jgi:hypothetical protein